MDKDTDRNDSPEPQVPSPDGSRTWVAKMLIAALVLPIRAYQILISPLIGPHCRFTPTCSGYAIEAIRKYGPVKGSWRAARRIGRCHPWNPGGYDPP